ncbi:ATP-dependent metallopeptidase FtsH/Yme1/Tma family protein, partial [Fodinibius sp.]|uniref:ATP-dependent metallopeptidase FtsH/Yme1/Tma family protein n=1 Tax=Fodinibius sp. TaxID=1872440 RepID=UPI0035613428
MAENRKQSSDNNNPQNKKGNKNPGGKYQYSFYWIIIATLLAFWLFSSQEGGLFGGPPTIDYSTFREQIQAGNVQKVTVRGEQIDGELKQKTALKASEDDTTQYNQFSTYLPSFGDEKLMDMLEANNVEVQTLP